MADVATVYFIFYAVQQLSKQTCHENNTRLKLEKQIGGHPPDRSSMTISQGWATVLVSGPHVGGRSPSRAGSLDGSRSVCSTTIIVRVALIGQQKKGVHTPQMFCFPPKISVKQWRSGKLQKGAIISTFL